jgi:hypothetical protein
LPVFIGAPKQRLDPYSIPIQSALPASLTLLEFRRQGKSEDTGMVILNITGTPGRAQKTYYLSGLVSIS